VDNLRVRPLEKATIYAFFDSPNATRNARLIIYRYNDEFNVEADPIINKAKVDSSTDYVYADITSLVLKWVNNRVSNYGLLVKAEADGVSLINRTLDEMNRTIDILLHLEFINGNLHQPWNIASERSDQLCSVNQPNENCCRYPLEIDLNEVGFGFVVSPRRIKAFYCAGECPFGHLLASRHAHLMQQLGPIYSNENEPSSPRNVGRCCVPTDYQNLTVAYMPNNHTVKETTMVNIIALRCGCS